VQYGSRQGTDARAQSILSFPQCQGTTTHRCGPTPSPPSIHSNPTPLSPLHFPRPPPAAPPPWPPPLQPRRSPATTSASVSNPGSPSSPPPLLLQTHLTLPFPLSLPPLQAPDLGHPPVAASASAGARAPASPPLQGAALTPLLASVATGVLIWFIPAPSGVPRNAWQLLAIFLSTIVGIITQPLPLGAVALLGLGAAVLTRTLTFAAAFSAFGDPIPWLIALAFFFARGFIKTGLGKRVAYAFVSAFGGSSLGLGYALVFAEAVLAPAIPSVSARAGGIFLPLVKSLCEACGSRSGDGTERRLGAWLMLTCFQTSVVSSAMFLTAMAANPLSANLTAGTIGQGIGWTLWAKAAIVPGLLSLVLVPLILYVIYPPEMKSSPDAPRLAKEQLAKMGPMTKQETIMAGTLLLTVY
jgi:hypothetical protein